MCDSTFHFVHFLSVSLFVLFLYWGVCELLREMEVEKQLERAIIEMQLNPWAYSPQEVADAVTVYSALPDPEFVGEAAEIVAEHHQFIGSQLSLLGSLMLVGVVAPPPVPPRPGSSVAGGDDDAENGGGALSEQQQEAEQNVQKSAAQQKADQLAAAKRLKALRLEEEAKKKEERNSKILASGANRAKARRDRAERAKAGFEARAEKLKQEAIKKVEEAKKFEAAKNAEAAKRVAQGGKVTKKKFPCLAVYTHTHGT